MKETERETDSKTGKEIKKKDSEKQEMYPISISVQELQFTLTDHRPGSTRHDIPAGLGSVTLREREEGTIVNIATLAGPVIMDPEHDSFVGAEVETNNGRTNVDSGGSALVT